MPTVDDLDNEFLRVLLDDLHDDGFDVDEIGFSDGEIAEMRSLIWSLCDGRVAS